MIILVVSGLIAAAVIFIATFIWMPVHYNSRNSFYRKVISKDDIARMHLEHWYTAITPVIPVQYLDDPPPYNPQIPRRPEWPE